MLNMNKADELEIIRQNLTDIRAQLATHHLVLMGDQATSGLIQRVRDLEKTTLQSEKELSEDITAMRSAVAALTAALLGDMTKGSESQGLLSVVKTHDKMLEDMRKFAWLLIGGVITLGLTQIWQVITAYQALRLIQK